LAEFAGPLVLFDQGLQLCVLRAHELRRERGTA
jgi:hypothetical protein